MQGPQFIPVIFANKNDGPGGTVPYSGHAGYILVSSTGEETYYEYGQTWDSPGGSNAQVITNSTGNGSVRRMDLPKAQIDSSGNLTQNSVKQSLNQISTKLYRTVDPGLIFATPFNISTAQYSQIKSSVPRTPDEVPNYNVITNNCMNFTDNSADAGNLTISREQHFPIGAADPNIAIPDILAKSKIGYEYTAPNSWRGETFQEVGESNWATQTYQTDRVRQFDKAVGAVVHAVGVAAQEILTIAHDLITPANPSYTPSARQTIINRLRGGQAAASYTPVPDQSPLDQLRQVKGQASAAPAQPLSPAMQARQAILRTLPTQIPSISPIPGGGTAAPPPRGGAADLMMQASGGGSKLPRQLTAALEQAARAGTPLTPDDVQNLARQLSAANPQHPMLREVASGPALAAARQALLAAAGTVSARALAPGARATAGTPAAGLQTSLSMAEGHAAATASGFETPATLAPGPLAGTGSAPASFPLFETAASSARGQRAFEDAITAFFDRQARRPPASGAAFDPLCTPAWPAWKFPS